MRKTTNDTGYIRKVFYSEKDKCWVAIAPEIPGCSALGDTDNKALQELGNAIKLHIQIRKKNKLPIPQALSKQKLGGRFLLRIPKVLQHNLKEEAMEEGVSVNQYTLFLISTARAQLHPFSSKAV
ncbi:MAG: type II toxin-antitoxin system HicB family antitoxin [Candidatus Aureabacteria bacterium]|nr:type II toxin-antitoxin system HicB family antitoxin [Candidatus Auribacterota bacterium]